MTDGRPVLNFKSKRPETRGNKGKSEGKRSSHGGRDPRNLSDLDFVSRSNDGTCNLTTENNSDEFILVDSDEECDAYDVHDARDTRDTRNTRNAQKNNSSSVQRAREQIVDHRAVGQVPLTDEEIKLRIMNDKNIMITKEYIDSVFARVGFDHTVKNIELFQTSMIHESYTTSITTNRKVLRTLRPFEMIDPKRATQALPLFDTSYERLEYLGDSVIHYALAQYLFDRYPDRQEGFLTTTRSKIEQKITLSKYAKELGFQKYAIIGYYVEQENSRISDESLTEDIFEAFVGALNIEVGIVRACDFVIRVIETIGDLAEIIRTETNYKDQLMRHFHRIDPNCRHDLKYVDQQIDLGNDKKRFDVNVYDKMTGQYLGEGSGRTKQKAEKRAAKNALLRLGLIGGFADDDEVIEVDFDVDDLAADDAN